MNCPNCGATHTIVKAMPEDGESVVRERWCPVCLLRFKTEERLSSVYQHQAFQVTFLPDWKEENAAA